MSTFNGIVQEFPDIRIDFFRLHRDARPPSACFLSHIHSDHLQGLEAPVLPFVYCSAATRRLLLRMEKYPHRINFAKGILEARKQSYKHLKKVLKALPLQAPTVIGLTPKTTIRVTLFDANHCPGAVMFLIEGDGKAILYTGDVRSEAWWVNSIARHPVMIPYTMGRRTLDCLYMDTTFATKDDIYREFQSKASGLAELIEKVEQYPPEAVFYFQSWTLGYEDAWLALSSALGSRIHVDAYQTRLYKGLLEDSGEQIGVQEAASLVGFAVGNHPQEGCLTDDPTVPVRIHSCEPGTACHASLLEKQNLVWVTPIIARKPDGTELFEIGAGGGRGDLYQTPELDITDPNVLQTLQTLCADSPDGSLLLERAMSALEGMSPSGGNRISLSSMGISLDSETDVTLKEFIAILSDSTASQQISRTTTADAKLTTAIRFPYSRHSSYNELRELVTALKPKDICPCTVDLDSWSADVSMKALFGDLCSGQLFAHDAENRILAAERREALAASRKRKRETSDNGMTQRSLYTSDDTFETAEVEEAHDKWDSQDADMITKPKQPPPDQQHQPPAALASIAPAPAPAPAPPVKEDEELDTPARRLQAIKAAFHSLGDDHTAETLSTAITSIRASLLQASTAPATTPAIELVDLTADVADTADENNEESPDSNADTQSSHTSLSLSAFDSPASPQPLIHQVDVDDHAAASSSVLRLGRLVARLEAYRAAKASLNGDCSYWDDLGLRSMGYVGHVEEEVEL